MDTVNVVLCGLGGQGCGKVAAVIAETAWRSGFQVTHYDVVGVGQRAGSVVSHVRFGPEPIASPLVPRSRADLLVAMELYEAVRCASLAAPHCSVLLHDYEVRPRSVDIGLERGLGQSAREAALRLMPRCSLIDKRCEMRDLNIYFLGLASAALPFAALQWHAALGSVFAGTGEKARTAVFDAGRDASAFALRSAAKGVGGG